MNQSQQIMESLGEAKVPSLLTKLLAPHKPKKPSGDALSRDGMKFTFEKDGWNIRGQFWDKGNDQGALNLIGTNDNDERESHSISFDKDDGFKKVKKSVDDMLDRMKD